MKAVIYDTDTGRIKRQLQGHVPVDKQVLQDGEDILTDENAAFPDSYDGKLVDADSETFVDDPEYDPPLTSADVADQLRAGDIDMREALLWVLEQ